MQKPTPTRLLLASMLASAALASTANAAGETFSYGECDGYALTSGSVTMTTNCTWSGTSSDANVIQVKDGSLALTGYTTITKTGDTSTSGDETSFFGINSAVYAGNSDDSASPVIAMTNGYVTTSAKGANAFFAYGPGVLYLENIAVTNTERASRGLIATGGGKIYAHNMYIETQQETSSVIATDKGGGTVVVDGGTYVAKGNKCAIIYSAGDMYAYNAKGSSESTSNGEIADVEGDNTVTISNCTFSCNGTSRGLLLMQSGSGDASGYNPVVTVTDSSLTMTDSSAPLIEVATAVNATITLDNTTVTVPSDILMYVQEDSQWSTSGATGTLILTNGNYSGIVKVDEGYTANVTIASTATWTLTANTTVSNIVNYGTIATNNYTLTYASYSGSGKLAYATSDSSSDDDDDSGTTTDDDDDDNDENVTTAEAELADETGVLDGRPELTAFPYKEEVTAKGTYEVSTVGTNFVLTGTWTGNVTITNLEDVAYRVTLKDYTNSSGVLTLYGDAQLWLEGENTLTTTKASAIVNGGTLTIGGTGTLAATAAGAKKTGVIAGVNLILAGGDTTLTISSPTKKNASGVSLSGNYTQLAGTLKILDTDNDSIYKLNGIYMSTKKMTATISGGTLDISLDGEKSVGLSMDKSSINGTMSGGVIKLAMSGDGAKGIKGDGSFTMTDGVIDAEITGGYVEEMFEYEDTNEDVWNYYITLDDSSTTSGNSYYGSSSITEATSTLISNGTYVVYDPSKAYAVKVGTLNISDGLVRIRCTGTCGRGMGADNMYLSGGVYDIQVDGGPTDVYVESLIDADDLDDDTATNGTVTVCLDSGGAACLKTSGTNSVMSITGGTFELKATGNAGKLINAAGYLVIGNEGATTLPSDSSFAPDIQGQALGEKVFCTVYKQKYYGSLGTAIATTNISEITYSVASSNIVTSTSSSSSGGGNDSPGGNGGNQGGPDDKRTMSLLGEGPGEQGGGGSDDDYDYSNPKGIKGTTDVKVYSGRIRIYTANDGGEGLESKAEMTIEGGVIELNCADDCINTGDDLIINDGYIYAGSTGNDAIDSNNDIYIEGGYILAFTLSNPECGIDLDNSTGLYINGGYVFTLGSAQSSGQSMVYGSSGSQNSYLSASTTLTPGGYFGLSGTDTYYAQVPTISGSTSVSCSVMCSIPGTSSSPSLLTSSSAPSGTTALGFHGIYKK